MLYNIFVINKHLKYKPQWRYASITWVMFIAVLARANAQGVASLVASARRLVRFSFCLGGEGASSNTSNAKADNEIACRSGVRV